MRVGAHPGRRLRDHQTHVGDVVDQAPVSRGIGAVGAAREHRHGGSTAGERTAVRRLVDAEGGPGDDGPRLPREHSRRCRRRRRRRRSWPTANPPPPPPAPRPRRVAAARDTTGRRARRRVRADGARRARSSRRDGPLVVSGDDEPEAPRRRHLQLTAAGRRTRSVAARSSPSSRFTAGSRRFSSTNSAPSSWTASVSRGSPGSPMRESATRASRSDSGTADSTGIMRRPAGRPRPHRA